MRVLFMGLIENSVGFGCLVVISISSLFYRPLPRETRDLEDLAGDSTISTVELTFAGGFKVYGPVLVSEDAF